MIRARAVAALALAAALTVVLAACATSSAHIDALATRLAAQDSATAVLNDWCAAHAGAARIAAHPIADHAPEPADLRQILGTAPGEPIGFRHVALACGQITLSDARNWYIPARLTPAMNAALAQSNTPFGAVVAPLHFTRRALASQHGAAPGCPAETVLSNRALLVLPDGTPLAVVAECYTKANLR